MKHELDRKEVRYNIAILVVVLLYLISSFVFDIDPLSKRISTVTTLIAAVAFWLQFRRNENLNEASYIMNLNNQFINNKDMTFIEHNLELYFNEYETIYKKYKKNDDEFPDIELQLDLSRESEDCQKLINYLVYLEALAAIIKNNVLHIDIIDDLFAYRFFLAVNNPIVQETEILPYKDYYQGIQSLSKEWTDLYKKQGISIPMEEFNLVDKYPDDIKKDAKADSSMKRSLSVKFSKADTKDDKNEIAECIYDTDPYIYPTAFGKDRENAIKAIEKLIGEKEGLFDLNNIVVAKYNKHIQGVCLIYDKPSAWYTEEYYKKIDGIITKRDAYEYVSKHYFETTTADISDNEVYIMAFCISKTFRGRGIAKPLMDYVFSLYPGKTICLEVLSDNEAAIKLYESKNFITTEEKNGFSYKEPVIPKCKVMKRYDSNLTEAEQ